MTYKFLVLDDEAPAREKIIRYIKRLDYNCEISTASNAVQGIRLLETAFFDIIILDIQMPQMNAFEMLQKLKLENLPTIVFSTAYDQYALKAFEFHAVDYLLKPFHFDRFEKSISHAIQLQNWKNNPELRLTSMMQQWRFPKEEIKIIWVSKAGKIFPVSIKSIVYIEAEGNYINIYSNNERFLIRQSLKDIYNCIDKNQFVQVHKSFVLNKLMIKELIPKSHGDLSAIMMNGQKVPVSRRYRESLLN